MTHDWIARLLCRWLGHRWSPWWSYEKLPICNHILETGRHRLCGRCWETQYRDVHWHYYELANIRTWS